MISIAQLYKDFKGRENTWQGGHVAIKKNFEGWVHEVQIEIQNELIKEFEKSQVITDNLRSFLQSVVVPIKHFPNGGNIPYPKDYRFFCSLRFFSKSPTGKGCLCANMKILDLQGKCRELTEEEKAEAKNASELCERTIPKIDNQRWGAACDNSIIPPSIERPISTQDNNGFKVLPKSIGVVVLDYISLPIRPILKYSYDENQNETFDEAASTNLVWGEEMLPEILARLKKRYSAYTRNEQGYQQGELERQIATS